MFLCYRTLFIFILSPTSASFRTLHIPIFYVRIFHFYHICIYMYEALWFYLTFCSVSINLMVSALRPLKYKAILLMVYSQQCVCKFRLFSSAFLKWSMRKLNVIRCCINFWLLFDTIWPHLRLWPWCPLNIHSKWFHLARTKRDERRESSPRNEENLNALFGHEKQNTSRTAHKPTFYPILPIHPPAIPIGFPFLFLPPPDFVSRMNNVFFILFALYILIF